MTFNKKKKLKVRKNQKNIQKHCATPCGPPGARPVGIMHIYGSLYLMPHKYPHNVGPQDPPSKQPHGPTNQPASSLNLNESCRCHHVEFSIRWPRIILILSPTPNPRYINNRTNWKLALICLSCRLVSDPHPYDRRGIKSFKQGY